MQKLGILRRAPLHSFLIGLYIISFIFVRNISQVTFSMAYRSIIASFLLAGIIFGISYFFYRSTRKAGIFTTLLIVGFFTYGFIYNQLEILFYKGLWPFLHIHRFLVTAYLIIYLILFILFLRSARPHHTVNYTLNVFVIGVFLLNALMGITSSSRTTKIVQKNPLLSSPAITVNQPETGLKPDVYYIILDGYASEKSLQQFYGIPQPTLYTYLRKKGFYVADSSRTNYPFTAPSLSSSLNAVYIDSLKNIPPQVLVSQNRVSAIFKAHHYKVVNIQSGYAITETLDFADKTITIKGLNEFESRLLELTILKLDDILGFTNYTRLKSELDRMPLVAQEKGPKFGFIHIVSPHPPFVVDSVGNRKIRSSFSDMAWEPKSDYIGQLEYLTKRVINFIDSIQKNATVPPIILLQSDHGSWINSDNPRKVYEARSSILNAYFVPDAYKNKLYHTITPVNSFRIILSELFKQDMPLLEDKPVCYEYFLNDPTFQKYAD